MRGLSIHTNIHVSVIELMLALRLGFISFHMTAVNCSHPRAITGDEPPARGKKHANIKPKPRLILVAHTHDLSWYITSN